MVRYREAEGEIRGKGQEGQSILLGATPPPSPTQPSPRPSSPLATPTHSLQTSLKYNNKRPVRALVPPIAGSGGEPLTSIQSPLIPGFSSDGWREGLSRERRQEAPPGDLTFYPSRGCWLLLVQWDTLWG
jgi:hypothetical protein